MASGSAAAVLDGVRAELDVLGEGKLAVITPRSMVGAVFTALTAQLPAGTVAHGAVALDAPVAVLSTGEAKGLEFDTVVLVGGLSARHEGDAALAFGAGAGLASVLWFYGLAYGARLAAPLLALPRAWQVLDTAVGIVMWGIAARLVAGAIAAG